MRTLLGLLVVTVALTGCFGGGNETVEDPSHDDMMGMGNDTANMTVQLPPAQVAGLVVGPDFVPIEGAEVFVETVDLTDPVNNMAEYVAVKEATLNTSNENGEFSILWNDSYQRIAVRAPGFTPWASDNLSVPQNATLELSVVMNALPQTTVTAHRGGALYAPDNTLAALHKAGMLGIPRAEVDVQWTSDEVLVLWHDGVVEDQTGNRVWQTSSEDMRSRDVGSEYHPSFANETVPTLGEALDVMAIYGTIPVVEIKITDDPRHAQFVEAVIAEVKAKGVQDTAIIISFDPSIDTQCGAGGMLCGYIEAEPQGQRTDPAGLGNDALGPFIIEHHMPEAVVTPEYVQESHDAGLLVTVWTPNDVDTALAYVTDAGVDAITTDIPWDVMQALADAGL